MADIDLVRIKFDPGALLLLNVVLALIMFTVALEIRWSDFARLAERPRAFIVALVSQYLLMPALALAVIWLLKPPPSVALGMILVAACPSGNLSNYLTHLAHGNTALSVGITSLSTIAAIVVTPLMLGFWGAQSPGTAALMQSVAVDPWRMVLDVVLVIGVPLALGVMAGRRWPQWTARWGKRMQTTAFAVLLLFVVIGSARNFDIYRAHLGTVFMIVLLGDALAFTLAYLLGRAARLPVADRRALAFETGKRNTGLGLILVFNFFGGLGGMALVAAWWGTWDIVVGTALAHWWRRRPPAAANASEVQRA